MKEQLAYILAHCRKGSRNAQLQLYKQFARQLYIACFRIIGNSSDAEEAMQDAFLKIFTRLDQFTDGQCFEAWMHRIAVHTAIDYVRKQTPDFETLNDNILLTDGDEAALEEEDHIDLQVHLIKAACQELPAGYRVILSLYLFEGYDTEEIADILKIQPGTVRTQYLRAKRKLLTLIKS